MIPDSKQTASWAPERPRPTRNLSAYNFYFKDKRRRLLEALPPRSEGKPRRSHGKIGFSDLARTIASGWKSLDAGTRAYYENLAVADKERYARELEAWKGQRKKIEQRKLPSQKIDEPEGHPISRMSAVSRDPPLERRHSIALPPVGYPEFLASSPGYESLRGIQSSLLAAQVLDSSLRSNSRRAIEQLARPLRAAASEPDLQSAIPRAASSRADRPPPAVTAYFPTFDPLASRTDFSASAIHPPSPPLALVGSVSAPLYGYLDCSIGHCPGSLALPRQEVSGAAGAPVPYSRLRLPAASMHPTPELQQRLVQHLANELDSEGVDMFLDLFRGPGEN
jgi:hypothetical protein